MLAAKLKEKQEDGWERQMFHVEHLGFKPLEVPGFEIQ